MRATQLTATWDPRPGFVPTPTELARKKAPACRVWRHPRVDVVDLPEPSPGPHAVVVRVRACGICGSDTHCIETDGEGYVTFSGPTALPCVLGHEYAGEIVAVGSEVRDLRVGQLVTAEGMLWCGVCEACRRGHLNQCARLEMVGFSAPGAYADFIAVHEKHCFAIDALADRLGDAQRACEVASLVEPVGCSYNGIFVAAGGLAPGAHVVVFGCGPIGLGAVALTRVAGAATITVFDEHPARLQVARRLGADGAHDLGNDSPADVIREATRGWGADLVVEAAGAAVRTMPEIEASLAPRGTMVYLGRTGERAPVMLDALVTQAGRIVGARGHAGGGVFPNLIRLMERGRLDLEPLITARLPLTEAPDALARSRTRQDAKIVLVAPGSTA